MGLGRPADKDQVSNDPNWGGTIVSAAQDILVIDDSSTICKLLSKELDKLGFNVTTALSMEEAFHHVSLRPFNITLTDLVMPGLGGLKGIRELRRLLPDMSIIAMSGGSKKDTPEVLLEKARYMGADSILMKPFTAQQLQEKIRVESLEFSEEGHKKRVLVVDDSSTMCKVISKMLDGEPYSVSTALSMEDALASSDLIRLDLLITDIFMDGMGGIEGIKKVRANWPYIKIIAMSGSNDSMKSEAVLKAASMIGADHTLRKPFDQATLLAAMELSLA